MKRISGLLLVLIAGSVGSLYGYRMRFINDTDLEIYHELESTGCPWDWREAEGGALKSGEVRPINFDAASSGWCVGSCYTSAKATIKGHGSVAVSLGGDPIFGYCGHLIMLTKKSTVTAYGVTFPAITLKVFKYDPDQGFNLQDVFAGNLPLIAEQTITRRELGLE